MIEVKISHEVRHSYDVNGRNPCFEWCIENLGLPQPNGKKWAWNTAQTFWFEDSRDAMLFTLLWAGTS